VAKVSSVSRPGVQATLDTLALWNREPGPVLRGWLALSTVIAAALLLAVWIVSELVVADPTPFATPGVSGGGDMGDILHILRQNIVVLALHATACVAGFIAGASMPLVAAQKTGFSRVLHLRAGQIAIILVVCITTISMIVQAYALGLQGASLAGRLEISQAALILSVLPHAVPELVALFLPLAAWIVASRRGDWDQLLAATLITGIIAIPVLFLTATIEVELWPRILQQISPAF